MQILYVFNSNAKFPFRKKKKNYTKLHTCHPYLPVTLSKQQNKINKQNFKLQLSNHSIILENILGVIFFPPNLLHIYGPFS